MPQTNSSGASSTGDGVSDHSEMVSRSLTRRASGAENARADRARARSCASADAQSAHSQKLLHARHNAEHLDQRDAEIFRRYYSAAQFRTEMWNRLALQIVELRRHSERGTPVALENALATVRLLSALEFYHAHPGERACAAIARDLSAQRLEDASRHVARVAGELLRSAEAEPK